MAGREQRVRHLAERLQRQAPAQGQKGNALEVLQARLQAIRDRIPPLTLEERARAMVVENPERAEALARAILRLTGPQLLEVSGGENTPAGAA